jgi:large subunit ribosomal protein L10
MRAEKTQMVQSLKTLLSGRPVVLINYKGLKANVFNEFRGKLASIGAECHVVPNTLLSIAARELELTALAEADMSGDTALISGDCDVVAMVKTLLDFAKGKSPLAVKFSYVEGALLDEQDTRALADLPSREILLSQLLGVLQAPGSQLVRVLNAKVASIVYVLDAFCKKNEQVA